MSKPKYQTLEDAFRHFSLRNTKIETINDSFLV